MTTHKDVGDGDEIRLVSTFGSLRGDTAETITDVRADVTCRSCINTIKFTNQGETNG